MLLFQSKGSGFRAPLKGSLKGIQYRVPCFGFRVSPKVKKGVIERCFGLLFVSIFCVKGGAVFRI